MKTKLTLLLALSLAAPIPAFSDAPITQTAAPNSLQLYAAGWAMGWRDGWQHVKGAYTVAPPPPAAPVPEPGQQTYRDGYRRGLLAGIGAAQRP